MTSIGNRAFYGYEGLTSVTIPNSVKSIGDGTFQGCNNIQTLNVYLNNPIKIRESTFSDSDKSVCVLYVPKGTSKLYKAAPVWRPFINIVEMPGEVTAVNSPTSDNNIKVFASGKTIIVKGAASDAPVMVKSSNGVLLKSTTGNAMIPMENEGIYIVIVGQQTFKVLL